MPFTISWQQSNPCRHWHCQTFPPQGGYRSMLYDIDKRISWVVFSDISDRFMIRPFCHLHSLQQNPHCVLMHLITWILLSTILYIEARHNTSLYTTRYPYIYTATFDGLVHFCDAFKTSEFNHRNVGFEIFMCQVWLLTHPSNNCRVVLLKLVAFMTVRSIFWRTRWQLNGVWSGLRGHGAMRLDRIITAIMKKTMGL